MGCCSSTSGDTELNPSALRDIQAARVRKPKYMYYVTFNSRPLNIELTSSRQKDAYVTGLKDNCPLVNAEKVLAINSKIIKVNNINVEGLEMSEIAKHLARVELPLRLQLIRPEGLEEDEVPL